MDTTTFERSMHAAHDAISCLQVPSVDMVLFIK